MKNFAIADNYSVKIVVSVAKISKEESVLTLIYSDEDQSLQPIKELALSYGQNELSNEIDCSYDCEAIGFLTIKDDLIDQALIAIKDLYGTNIYKDFLFVDSNLLNLIREASEGLLKFSVNGNKYTYGIKIDYNDNGVFRGKKIIGTASMTPNGLMLDKNVLKESKFVENIVSFFDYDRDGVASDEYGIKRAREILSEMLKPNNFKVYVSKNIPKIYKRQTGSSNTGTLGNSCMRPESSSNCHNYVDLYSVIPFGNIAYISNKNKLESRAIVWNGIKDLDSGKIFSFMDRVYASELNMIKMFDWAKSKGIYRKVEQSYSNPELTLEGSEKIVNFETPEFFIPKNFFISKAPYFDTLRYMYVIKIVKNGAYIKLSSVADSKNAKILNDASGANIGCICPECGSLAIDTFQAKSKTSRVCTKCGIKFGDYYYSRKNGVAKSMDGFEIPMEAPNVNIIDIGKKYAMFSPMDYVSFVNKIIPRL